jgi:hypothetical protein
MVIPLPLQYINGIDNPKKGIFHKALLDRYQVSVVQIRIHFIRIRIQAFAQPESEFKQGFLMNTKNKNYDLSLKSGEASE